MDSPNSLLLSKQSQLNESDRSLICHEKKSIKVHSRPLACLEMKITTVEEAERIANDLAALDEAIAAETERDYKPLVEGEADGAFGVPPVHPDWDDYWKGYCRGLRSYYRQGPRYLQNQEF